MKKTKLTLILCFMGLFGAILSSFIGKSKTIAEPSTPIYEIAINGIDGKPMNLADYKGKKILFVNVASECGFTPQYKELESLYNQHKETLVIIGVPCNQFGGQEPGKAEEIVTFCERNYGVTFPLTEKVDVKGDNQHPLYTWLTDKEKNGVNNSSVKWNFQKYLVNEKGQFVDVWFSATSPLSEKITKHLE